MRSRRTAVHHSTARFALAFPPITLSGADAELASTIVALGGRARIGRRSATSHRAVDRDAATATVETVVEPRSFSRETEYADEDTTQIDWSEDRAELEANRAEWERRRERLRRA